MENILQKADALLQELKGVDFASWQNQTTFNQWNDFSHSWSPVKNQINTLEESSRKQLLMDLFDLTVKYESFNKIDLSFILQVDFFDELENPACTNHILERIYEQDSITVDSIYFLYWQVQMAIFPKSYALANEKTGILLQKIYQVVFQNLEKEFSKQNYFKDHAYIPTEDRDTDLIIVTVGQLQELGHGPTKTTLDRCYILAKVYNKRILLVETAELGSMAGNVPLIRYYTANHKYKAFYKTTVQYKGIELPLIQINTTWSLEKRCDTLLEIVREKRPLFILNIGGNSPATDICSHLLPTYCISTIPSGLIPTEGTFQMTGHKLTKDEENFLHNFGKNPFHIIEGIFTSSIISSDQNYTKSDLGLPTGKFLIVMVGVRLTEEITRNFMEMLLPFAKQNAFFAFIGRMDTYDDFAKNIPGFQENSKYLAFIDNVVSAMKLFDLYINPPRTGGGTSCVEALSVGVPVLSYNSGDVSVNVGEDFCVDTTDEFCQTLEKYLTDTKFHAAQSEKAKKRSEILLDSSKNFSIVVEEFYRRAEIDEKYWYSNKTSSPVEAFDHVHCYFDYDVFFDKQIPQELKDKYNQQENNTNPVFTIMMAVYNDTTLLNTAINSLLRQDFQSWELLIIDNSDKTEHPWMMLQNAMEFDSRIHAFKSEKNVGWAKGSSILLEKASGSYVTFLSADDCINYGALGKLNSIILEESPDVIFVGHGCINYPKQKEGRHLVNLMSELIPPYRVYGTENRSQAIVDIMQHVYYNSMFHYCRTDFLREQNIDFFDPYYCDSASMTHAMATANSIVVLNELVYYLTLNTSQTAGHYIWNSYTAYSNQWNDVKQVFARESCQDNSLLEYALLRIWNNFVTNIGKLCYGNCRNKYMNPINVRINDILRQLEDIFSNETCMEMISLMGEKGINDLMANLSNITAICQDPDENAVLENYMKNTGFLPEFMKLAINR